VVAIAGPLVRLAGARMEAFAEGLKATAEEIPVAQNGQASGLDLVLRYGDGC